MTTDPVDVDRDRERFGPWALVAGASDGIGECFARQLAERGFHVALLARREDALTALADDIASRHGVSTRVVVADLTGDDLMSRVVEGTRDLEVGLLVYNAGAVHGVAPFLERPVEHALALVALNCRGPILLAHHFGQRMRERRKGGIVLVTSMAGFVGSAYTATYCATKSFELVLAEGLWHELGPQGVDVLAVVAGATRTPSVLRSNPGFGSYPGVMEPEDVARGALASLGRGPAWVAGDANRQAAKAFRSAPRPQLVNGMSAAVARIHDLPHVEVDGVDFGELS